MSRAALPGYGGYRACGIRAGVRSGEARSFFCVLCGNRLIIGYGSIVFSVFFAFKGLGLLRKIEK